MRRRTYVTCEESWGSRSGFVIGLRCERHGVRGDSGEKYASYRCEKCGSWLRPDITWFGDNLDEAIFAEAARRVKACDLFVAVGTSGSVWPAAGYPVLAREQGASCLEINPEPSGDASIYHVTWAGKASAGLARLCFHGKGPCEQAKFARDAG